MTTMTMIVITTQIPFVAGGTSDSMGASDPAVEEGHPLTTNLWAFHFGRDFGEGVLLKGQILEPTSRGGAYGAVKVDF